MGNDIDIRIKAKAEGTQEVQKLEKQLSALGKIDAFKKLKRDVDSGQKAWKAAQIEVARLAKEIETSEKPTAALSRQFKAAQKEAGQLKTSFQKQQQALQKLRGSMKDAGIDTGKLNAEQKKLQVALGKTRQELARAAKEEAAIAARRAKNAKLNTAREMLDVRPFRNIQREIKQLEMAYGRLKKSGKLSMAELYKAKLQLKAKTAELKDETNGWYNSITKAQAGLASLAAIGFTVVQSFQGYAEFSQRMAEVNTLLDVSSGKFNTLTEDIVKLSTRIPQTAAEYDIISAGVALENSTRVLELSAKAAVAGVTDTKTAVSTGVGVINAYSKDISELGAVYDILFQTVKSGVTTFPQLAQHIGEVLPTARSASIDFHEVAAAIAAMTKAGIQTPKAATALKGAINAMAAPTPEAKKKFEELGITWDGLLPTLDAIRKKGLGIDQMRFLIPDVEARTGVLAMTQNMTDLRNITDSMANSAGATNAAFDKMKDTPENQMKLFGNEISRITKDIGGFVSKGLLPAAKAVSLFINTLREVDKPTQWFVGSLMAAGSGFILWKLGLASIFLGLKGLGVQSVLAVKQLLTVASTATLAGTALKGVFAAGAIYGVYELGRLIKVTYEWRQAVNEARRAQERLYESSGRTMEKFKEFKDVKIPDDIAGKAPEELDDLRSSLAKARAYWTALHADLTTRAEETTMLGNATDEAIAAQKELKATDARLREIRVAMKDLEDAGKAAGAGMEKPAEAIMATKEQLSDFETQAKKAYEHATAEAKKYADQVIAWEEKIKYARLSTADKIRELGRKGLTEEEQWNDKRLQAEEKFSAAKQALASKDYDLAEKLARDTESLYADLAAEVKATENGDEVIKKSLATTKEIAMAGVQTVGDFVQELYSAQKKNAEASKAEWTATADTINQKLEDITQAREANIQIELSGVQAAQNTINKLIKDQTKHIKVKVTREVSTVQKKQTGGPILRASTGTYVTRSGRLPGYGGGDRIKALLEAGEFIIRKEAVSKYGAGLFHALNSMQMALPNMQAAVQARVGGLISSLQVPQIPRFAVGGAVGSGGPAETMIVRFQAGDQEAPVKITDPDSRMAMKALAKEMSRMRLIHAR